MNISTADPETKRANSDGISIATKLRFHAVAYTNAESKESADEEVLSCGNQENVILRDVITAPELVGYPGSPPLSRD